MAGDVKAAATVAKHACSPDLGETQSRGNAMAQTRLHVHEEYWALRLAECPCDQHLIEWLDENRLTDQAIFHFGTGGHHMVGAACAEPQRRNAVLGVTLMPEEHRDYMDLVLARPDVMRFDNVVFADIYLANPKLLPDVDVATLFHLCEYRSPKHDTYGAMSDLEMARLITTKVRPGGHILFYSGSFAFDRAREVIAAWEAETDAERLAPYKSLLVYRKRG
jgi:hypothetical protein